MEDARWLPVRSMGRRILRGGDLTIDTCLFQFRLPRCCKIWENIKSCCAYIHTLFLSRENTLVCICWLSGRASVKLSGRESLLAGLISLSTSTNGLSWTACVVA